jgi:hypothetical protein
MKNSFKIACLALAIATSFAACKGKGSATTDSVKTDSVKTDSVKTDTSKMADTTKKAATDTAKKM